MRDRARLMLCGALVATAVVAALAAGGGEQISDAVAHQPAADNADSLLLAITHAYLSPMSSAAVYCNSAGPCHDPVSRGLNSAAAAKTDAQIAREERS